MPSEQDPLEVDAPVGPTYRGLTLDGFQARAIQSLAEGRSVLVSAPTGTGKTLIADWIVEQALGDKQQVIYTAPIKALSNQKFRDYCRCQCTPWQRSG